MTREAKARVMNEVTYDINEAKRRMYMAVEHLEGKGLSKDAEQLYRMILRLEMFQNKY